MTSEEAIRELKIFSGTTKTRLSANFWKALEMAIKALSEEPCEDAISRQAVLDGLASIAKARAKSDAQKSLMGRVMFFTEHLPPVTPQPKTGHWLDVMVGDMQAQACDQCKTFYPLEYTGGGHKYCPNCGCRMVEPKERSGEE